MADGFNPEDLGVVKGLREEYDNLLVSQREVLAQKREIARLAGEEVGYATEAKNEAFARQLAAEEALKTLSQDRDLAKERLDILRASLEADLDKNKLTVETQAAMVKEADQLESLLSLHQDEIDLLKQQAKEEIGSQKRLEKRVELADQFTDSMTGILGMSDKWKSTSEGQLITLLQQKGGLTDIVKLMGEKVSLDNLAGNAMSKVVEATVLLAKEQDAAIASFRKATGAGSEYNSVIVDTEIELRTFGVSSEEAGAATAGLYKNMSQFTMMNKAAQKDLVKTSAILTTFGISADTSTKALHTMTKGLGMTGEAASATTRELFATGTALGIAPDVIFNEFGPAAQQLGGHGNKMISVFKGMAAASKATGVEMSALLQIAGQFDTFESGAQAVGKMNALLGGPYLNTVKMLNADEGERIRLMLQGLEASGKQWSSMGKFERMALANAAGIKDMNKANKLFGSSLAVYDAQTRKAEAATMSQKEFNEASKQAHGLWEKLTMIAKGFAVSLQPVVELLSLAADLILWLQEKMEGWFGTVVTTIAVIWLLRKAFTAITGTIRGLGKAIGDGLGKAVEGVVGGMGRAGKAAAAGAGGMLAFGAAILMVGLGIYYAATGLAEFVRAFKGLGPEQLDAVNEALVTLTVGFLGLVAGLIILAYFAANPVVIGALLAIGAAMFLIGVGVYLAATGMALLVTSIGENVDALIKLMMVMPIVVPLLASLVAIGGLAAYAVGALAIAFGLLAISLFLLPMDELNAAADLMHSMAELGKTDVSSNVVSTVKKVFAVVGDLDTDKVESAKSLIESIRQFNITAAAEGAAGTMSLEAVEKLLRTLIEVSKKKGGIGGPETAAAGNTGGNVYFSEKLVGRWDEAYKTKKYKI